MSEKDLLKGKRILIVDDEPDVLETLADLLTGLFGANLLEACVLHWNRSIAREYFWQSPVFSQRLMIIQEQQKAALKLIRVGLFPYFVSHLVEF